MTAQSGRDLLIKIQTDTGDFSTVAGLRAKTLKFNAKMVDITHSESQAAWRELLPGGGVKSVEISGEGIFNNAASDTIIRESFFTQSQKNYQLIIPGFGIVQGDFLISSLNYLGRYSGEASYELVLQSAGMASFTAE